MSDDPYAAVIADLEAKRAEIDKLIESLKAFRAEPRPPVNISPSGYASRPTITGGAGREFADMPMADAAKIVLERKGEPQTNAQILTALEAGGLVSKSENKLNTLGSILNRRANDVGDVVRVGRGTWGLPDWGWPQAGRDKPFPAANEEFNLVETGDD